MKKVFLSFLMLVSLLAPAGLMLGSAAAIDIVPCSDPKLSQTDVCPDVTKGATSGSNAIVDLMKTIIDVLSFIVGVASIIGIIAGGLRLILANGDSNGVASARSGLIYSLIGIAIVVVAQSIVAFVLNKI
jgi:hypothetical protein